MTSINASKLVLSNQAILHERSENARFFNLSLNCLSTVQLLIYLLGIEVTILSLDNHFQPTDSVVVKIGPEPKLLAIVISAARRRFD